MIGFRSIPLKNSYNEPLELASLLVHVDAQFESILDRIAIAGVQEDMRRLKQQQISRESASCPAGCIWNGI